MEENKNIQISYTNWKNETNNRNIEPIEVWFGETKWHEGKQWYLRALDIDKGEDRTFALTGINSFTSSAVSEQTNPKTEVHDKPKEVKLYTDGGSRGNPGPSAIGIAILDMDNKVLFKESKYLGITTNNQAEYQGLKQGLEMCHKKGYGSVYVYMDSLLVVNQMKGIYKVKNRDLWPIYESVKEYLNNFKHVTFTHVPRELNKLADGMVNECLDNQAG